MSNSDGRNIILLWNFGEHLPHYTLSQPQRSYAEYSR